MSGFTRDEYLSVLYTLRGRQRNAKTWEEYKAIDLQFIDLLIAEIEAEKTYRENIFSAVIKFTSGD